MARTSALRTNTVDSQGRQGFLVTSLNGGKITIVYARKSRSPTWWRGGQHATLLGPNHDRVKDPRAGPFTPCFAPDVDCLVAVSCSRADGDHVRRIFEATSHGEFVCVPWTAEDKLEHVTENMLSRLGVQELIEADIERVEG